ncbi:MAG: MBL fold metallo-hydrolase [Chitinophagales bacterium]
MKTNLLSFLKRNKNSIFFCSLFLCFFLIATSSCNKGDDDGPPPIVVKPPIVTTPNWFRISELNPQTHIIEERQSEQDNVSYLLEGEEKALMFDTGTGENQAENGFKIKATLEELTDLPITLLLSHFHFDHNQNIAEFDRVAFADLPILRQKVNENDVYKFTREDLFSGTYPSQVQVTEWLPVNTDIDLGNRIIQLVNIQGHTSESIAIIDKTNKLAFLGDYLYNGTLFVFDDADLPLYEESIDHLISILDSDYQLFGAHGTPKVSFEKLQRLKDFLVCISTEACPSSPETVFNLPVLYYQFEGMSMVVFQ